MLKTSHLTLFMQRTIIHNLEDQLELRYNTPRFTEAKWYFTHLLTRVNRSTPHSKRRLFTYYRIIK